MNVFKKIYCRAFQIVFRIAIPILPYRKPEIIAGISDIPSLLKEKGLKKPIIVTDPGIEKAGLVEPLRQSLNDYALYDKVVANPTTDTVSEALSVYKESGCDSIIGFGGGSSMDTAKALGALVARPRSSLSKMKGILKVRKKIPTLIAIPTTAGTGSETTLAAVIVDARTRHKYSINDFPLIPRYAVLDPKTTVGLPPFITCTTGMDALTHAVEAFIGRSTTRDTREDSLTAVRLIFSNLEKAYSNGSDIEARRNMLESSFRAGAAFTKSYVGYVHAVAHSLGGKYNIPHGLANAVLLPIVLESYGPVIHGKLKKLAVAAGVADESTEKSVAAKSFIDAIKAMKRDFGIGDAFPELIESDIPELSKHADKEANPLYPVPVLMNAKELERFYYAVSEKKND